MTTTDGLKITVESLQNLADGASCNPFVRIRMGDLMSETYTGVRCFDSNSSFEFKNVMVFPEKSLTETFVAEVVNCNDMRIWATAQIPDWRSKFSGRKSVAFVLALPGGGTLRMNLRLLHEAQNDQKKRKVPDRLDVLVASVGGVADKVHALKITGKLMDTEGNVVLDQFDMEPSANDARAQLARGTFEFNSLRTIAYRSQPLLVLDVMDRETNERLGTARYHLAELLEVHEPKHAVAGRLPVTNDLGTCVATMKVGLMLWNTGKYMTLLGQQRQQVLQLKDQLIAADRLQRMCESGLERVPYLEQSLEQSRDGLDNLLKTEIPEIEEKLDVSTSKIYGRGEMAETEKNVRVSIAHVQGGVDKASQALQFNAHQLGKSILKDAGEIREKANGLLQDSRVAPSYGSVPSTPVGMSPGRSPMSESMEVRGPDGETLNQEALYNQIKDDCQEINRLYEDMSSQLVTLSSAPGAGASPLTSALDALSQMDSAYKHMLERMRMIEDEYSSLSLLYKKYRYNYRQYVRYIGMGGAGVPELGPGGSPVLGKTYNPCLTCCMGI